MGAWSEENFGNDDAGDWVWKLEKSKGIDTLLSPINSVLSNDDYLESPDCCEALAAAEIIASSISGDLSKIPEEAQEWLNKRQGLFRRKPIIEKKHAVLAHRAVEKIVKHSELKELWEDSEDFSKWREVQAILLGKLNKV